MAPPAGAHRPGQLVGGRYKLLAILGHGGMGVVFKAEDTKLRRTVALKFLPEEIQRDSESKKRFLREAQAAAILDHPNICPVYEVDESAGEMFLTMAFVEGRSLRDRIAEGPLPLIEVLNTASQVGEGLEAAHEKGVVHRDVKPANIMLSREGQVRILDFGLASVEGGVDLTRPRTVMGTPAYMSPEQVRGEKTDARTDIWSFGVMLFEMATGRRPFAGEHGRTVSNEILGEAPPNPSSLRAELPAALDEIILRCLRKSADERYPDVESLLDALHGAGVRKPAAHDEKPAATTELPSVAVLPFADMSPAKDQDYFGEGLAEELIHALARLQGIRVVARTSAFAMKGLKLDAREIGTMLGVGAILEGSIRKSGRRLRITAQLIDTRTGLHIWSERYDREERDVFDIQDEISISIVEHLEVALKAGEKTALRRRSTTDPEAYNLYLKGLYFQVRPSPENAQRALEFHRQALELDPNFALAHTGIAFVLFFLGNANLAPPGEIFPKVRAAAERALTLDPDLDEALAILATLEFWFEWNWTAAEKSFRKVLSLHPGDASARGSFAWLLTATRRFEESLAEIKKALAVDPLMPMLYAYSIGLHWVAGRCDEALADFARVQQIEPNFGLAHFQAGHAYLRLGLFDKAIETFEKSRRLFAPPGWAEAGLIVCHMRKGDREPAERHLAEMFEARKTIPLSAMSLATGLAALGDLDKAFEWIDTSVRERDTLAVMTPSFANLLVPELAADPRFAAFVDRIGLPR
jgi:TolB-like protein/Flp pilus assembly protein TadD/predicted Ser/Thr protein kinase